ncbi:D-aminoacyl-tRNA deacylase [Clostridium sp. Cult3]|uniref:D-aminoacyl-tRNA deacylase n=1 Tax=Clostridium sp. Cult3 TaxID=2079004 RepID=UPI001EFFE99F|nr:D-aminoacyl-tRNA deacylase [Clostridium sp. Cult3]MCF6461359.1 D-tyrosyl-tRNA(Tyr) deacylase [Clostridium sp. Cult3]
MRAVVQRVLNANVKVNGDTVGKIGKGLLVFLGIGEDDDNKDLEYMVEKILGLRIFEDTNSKMNLSLLDVEGEILVISQFTLYGDVRKGKRPSFSSSARPEMAESMYNKFIAMCKERGIKAEEGIFGADMKVELINDGPVTILIDSKKIF